MHSLDHFYDKATGYMSVTIVVDAKGVQELHNLVNMLLRKEREAITVSDQYSSLTLSRSDIGTIFTAAKNQIVAASLDTNALEQIEDFVGTFLKYGSAPVDHIDIQSSQKLDKDITNGGYLTIKLPYADPRGTPKDFEREFFSKS